MEKNNKIYLGVYGVYTKEKSVLMIKKSRGPYIGLYDLPGGGLNFEENIEECLKREIKEETGAEVKQFDFIGNNEYSCVYVKDGILRDFHHVGLYYSVDLVYKSLKIDADGEDSLGSIFLPFMEINKSNTSPISYPIIKKIIDMKDV